MDVDISLIKPSPYQPRLDFSLEDLKGSIMKDGIASPLVVRQIDTGYELIDGERRLKLARKLGYGTVPCQVIEADAEKAMRLVWRLNVERKDYTPKEKAYHFRNRQIEGMSLREIGRLFGYDAHEVVMYLNVFKLPEEYQEAVWHGNIPIGNIRELETLFGGVERATPEIIDWLDQRLPSADLRKALSPTLAKYKEQQVQKAQEAVGDIAPEIALETPEDYEKAAQALKEEAKRRAEEAMTPEEKAEEERKKLVAEARKSLDSTAKKIDRASQVMDVSEFRERLNNIEHTLEKTPSEAKAQLITLGEEVTEAEKEAKAKAKAKAEEEKKREKAEEDQQREERAEKKVKKQLLENHSFLAEVLKAAPTELIEERLYTEEEREVLSKPLKPTTIMDQFYEMEKQSKKLSDGLAELTEFPPMGKALLGIALQTLRARIHETLERMGFEVIEVEAKLIERD